MKTHTSGYVIRSIMTIVALVLFACIIFLMGALKNTNSNLTAVIPHFIGTHPLPPVACTMDAKMCSDGSYVGRSGPNCEFVCPTK